MASTRRITVIGGGHGLASVLRALRDDGCDLTVIVTVGDDGGSSGQLRSRGAGPAVGDLRRSLVALSGENVVLGRALMRPVTVGRLGCHPLGNLMILSVADAFGDLPRAIAWLGERLEITGTVLPATSEAVSLVGEADGELVHGESAIGATRGRIGRLRFIPQRPAVPQAVLKAIEQADLCLLAPGSLFTSVLAASALPDVASALARTPAPVAWICNLDPEATETAAMTASDHLGALQAHGVRVDVALYDPRAKLSFAPGRPVGEGVRALPRQLQGNRPGTHDPALLRAAVQELFSETDRAELHVNGYETTGIRSR